ncbi:UBX domain-containing protein 7 [Sarcoptes scabiei]|uniref:UBX domain-containing protein 7 n=1 Tax=Sarcoptes scabiei TaxID=52283 RepID=A0A834R9Y3_SARSC|nr:UBX domain-containing protein 7 [Sarcoptes scabiei]UXI20386.1 polycomb group RING finger protein 3 [Sarcoptes scabiei]
MDNQNDIDRDDVLTQFINITGADESIAKNALEACDWNVEMAINMFVDSNLAQNPSTSSAIQTQNNRPQSPSSTSSTSSMQNKEIRPPIPPVCQVLVDDYSRNTYTNSSFDGFRNFEQESRWQERQLIDSDIEPVVVNKRKTWDDLFRPPLDLMFRGTFERAKLAGQEANKWLLVNIQNHLEFSCQALNRDVWSNTTVKDIIKEHFIFWQTYNDSTQGQNFISFYNVTNFPHISIIDPRTGEKLIYWNGLDTITFCEKVTQFLNEHPSPSKIVESNDVVEIEPKKTTLDYGEQSDLEAAIQASLRDMENYQKVEKNKSDSVLESVLGQNDRWENYLGKKENKMEILIRYPDGQKKMMMFPPDSKLKALFLYVTENGYNMNEYELITNFPKKNLSSCDENLNLESVMHHRETLYVQTKN